MPVPQPITEALAAVQADADVVVQALTDDKAADVALAFAQVSKQNTSSAVASAKAHLSTDLQALIALEQQTYNSLSAPASSSVPTAPVSP